MMRGKRGVIGDYLFMMYRLVLITIAAVFIMGICSLVYSVDINVRDSEARILARDTFSCFVAKDTLSLSATELKSLQYSLLDYCSFTGDLSRYYISLQFEKDGKSIVLEQGDSGFTFLREFAAREGGKFATYQPGYYRDEFFVDGTLVQVEVYVHA